MGIYISIKFVNKNNAQGYYDIKIKNLETELIRNK